MLFFFHYETHYIICRQNSGMHCFQTCFLFVLSLTLCHEYFGFRTTASYSYRVLVFYNMYFPFLWVPDDDKITEIASAQKTFRSIFTHLVLRNENKSRQNLHQLEEQSMMLIINFST